MIFKYQTLIIILLCFLTRIPIITSPELLMDGDECIVGLMAKHLYEGIEVPVYFYGQSYGFSFIETGFIAIFYKIGGITETSVKLAMLALWTLGIFFFFKTLQQLGGKNKWLPFIISLLFILSPSWVIWSMKARGGYLTAFLLSSILTYIIFKYPKNKMLIPAVAGFLLPVIYESQPLWLPGLIPFLLWGLLKNKPVKKILFFFSGIAISVTLFYFLKSNLSNFWLPKVLSLSNLSLKSVFSIPYQVYQNATGSYAYGDMLKSSFFTKIWAVAYTLGLTFIMGLGFIKFKTIKTKNTFLVVSLISVILTLGTISLTKGEYPRYLLPLTGFSLILFFAAIPEFKNVKLKHYAIAFFIILGSISVVSFRYYKQTQERRNPVVELVKQLEKEQLEYVFCKGGLLQWQIMFYSKEKVKARYLSCNDRYPPYILKVDNALQNAPQKTTLLGYYNNETKNRFNNAVVIHNKYFIVKNPAREILVEEGFCFKE